MLLDVSAVDSNHSHGMGVELEKSGGKCCHANDVDFVGLASGEFEGDILGVIQEEGIWEGWEEDGI